MAPSKHGLVDKVKRVAARAGTRGARVLVETAVVTVRTMDAIQSKLQRVRPGRADAGRTPSTPEPRRAAVTPRGAIESGRPVKTAAGTRKPSGRVSSAVAAPARQTGRKAVPGTAAAAKRGTASKSPEAKGKRGQKHRH